jgi:ATP-dependent protease ClpP protease subunit
MPSWNELLNEINDEATRRGQEPGPLDAVRRKYLSRLHKKTGGRNVIAYYSGFLQRQENVIHTQIHDGDMNAFMNAVKGLPSDKGLDLILHTPGGVTAATEAIVKYLHKKFGSDIRCFVPQLAMSAGTMIACACKCIYMGKQSSIGPTDPQFGNMAAGGVICEFRKASEEIKNDPATIPMWQAIFSKIPPGFITQCQQALDQSADLVSRWLQCSMLKDDPEAAEKIKQIVGFLNDSQNTYAHDNHIDAEQARKIGLKVIDLEDDQELQDIVLTIHHAYMETFNQSPLFKVVENHVGVGTFIRGANPQK